MKSYEPAEIDVLLCTFNRAHLIEDAIASVRAQSYTRWRLLVIDDGSTDNTADLVAAHQGRDPRIEYLSLSHGGLSRARNRGIAGATAPYLTFIDSDDEYAEDHLQLRYDYFRTRPEVDLIHGGVILIGAERDQYVVDAYNPDERIHISECCVGATLFGRRALFVRLGGFKIVEYSAESEFLERAGKIGVVKKVDFPTYKYNLFYDDRICKVISRAHDEGLSEKEARKSP